MFCFLENFRGKFANLPTELWNVYCVVKHTTSSNIWWKLRPNRCISGDAILPQTGTRNWPNCCPEFGGLLWHHPTLHEKPQYRCTTTVTHVHNSSKDVLEYLLPVWLSFGAHNLVHSEEILDYLYGDKLLRWNFLQISQSGALRRFLDFSQFFTAISRNLRRQLATNIRTM